MGVGSLKTGKPVARLECDHVAAIESGQIAQACIRTDSERWLLPVPIPQSTAGDSFACNAVLE